MDLRGLKTYKAGYFKNWDNHSWEDQQKHTEDVRTQLFNAWENEGREAFYKLQDELKEKKAMKIAWGLQMHRNLKKDCFKRDEIDVESLWQVQPEIKN